MAVRTTIRLEENLLFRARERAAQEKRTLTSLVEERLRLAIEKQAPTRRRRKFALPVSRQRGGVNPGVELSDSVHLLDAIEGRQGSS